MEPLTLSLLIFALVFILISIEIINKTLIVLLGAFLMIFYGIIEVEEIQHMINFEVLGIIFGVLLIVEIVKKVGVFQFLGIKLIKLSKGDIEKLFIFLLILTVSISAILGNITAILIVTTLTFIICRYLNTNPIPFIISQALISDIGGFALFISSVPSILVGTEAGFSFYRFIIFSTPLTLILAMVTILLLKKKFRDQLTGSVKRSLDVNEWSVVKNRKAFWRVLFLFIITICFIFISDVVNVRKSVILISAGILLTLFSGEDMDTILKDIDWGLLFFFSGLFVIVGSVEKTGFFDMIAKSLSEVSLNNKILASILILWISAIPSGILDNIAMTMTMIPIVNKMAEILNTSALWWSVLFGSIVGGNLFPLGSPTTVIAINISKSQGKEMKFSDFMKVGFPITLINLVIATLYVSLLSLLL